MSAATTARRPSRRIIEEVAPEPATDNKRQETATSGNGSGRDSKGRFTAGNPGGPGNPFARRVAQLRSVMLQCISDEDMQAITHAVLLKARHGDLQAVKLMYQYGIGKASDAVNPDTLDIEEYKQIYEPQKEIMHDALEAMHTVPPGALAPVVRAMNKECMKQMGAIVAAPPEMDDELARDPAAYLNKLAREQAAAARPAAEPCAEPQEEEDEEAGDHKAAPSMNRSNDNAADRPSINGPNGNAGRRPSRNGSNGHPAVRPSTNRPNGDAGRRPSRNGLDGDTGRRRSANGLDGKAGAARQQTVIHAHLSNASFQGGGLTIRGDLAPVQKRKHPMEPLVSLPSLMYPDIRLKDQAPRQRTSTHALHRNRLRHQQLGGGEFSVWPGRSLAQS
jgi:hypothetical protein